MILRLILTVLTIATLVSCGRRSTLIPPAPDQYPRQYPCDYD